MTVLDPAYAVSSPAISILDSWALMVTPITTLVAQYINEEGITFVTDNNWRFLPEPLTRFNGKAVVELSPDIITYNPDRFYTADPAVAIRDDNPGRKAVAGTAWAIRDENPGRYTVNLPPLWIRDDNPPRFYQTEVPHYLLKYWLFGGSADSSGVTIATVTTYYMRGWDSSGQFVYWSSIGMPDVAPATTVPGLSGALGNVCVVGTVTA